MNFVDPASLRNPKRFALGGFYSSLLIALLIVSCLTGSALADRIVESYNVPENSQGLAWDGQYLWIGGVGSAGDWIRSFDPDQSEIVDSIPAPEADCIGLSCLDDGRLAYISPRSDTTWFVSREGADFGFRNPVRNMGGLGIENNTLWSATFSERTGTLVLTTTNGRVLRSMPFTGRHSRDMAFHSGRLYIPDRLAQEIRVVNPESGRFIRTFETPGNNPDGITSDGTYLWILDDGDGKEDDRLYKILVTPDGNIRFSKLTHNFGSVVINDERDETFWIYNDGDRTARLSDFEVVNGNDDIFVPHMYRFPREIAGGDSAQWLVSFIPAYQDSVQIEFSFQFDIDEDAYSITLAGKGVRNTRDILIRDYDLNFGPTRTGLYVNSSNLRYLDIESNGGETLTIEELRFTNPSFFHGYYEFPLELNEPGLYRIPIFFQPEADVDSSYREQVTIISDDPDSPQIHVRLVGTCLLENYNGGNILWTVETGNREAQVPMVRAIQDIADITGDGLADVIIAANDYSISAYHAASTRDATPVWQYYTNTNPWRNGLVGGADGMSEGDDWDNDRVKDIVFGLQGGSKEIIALSGRTGEEIWKFDSHRMNGGGGNIIATNGETDFTGDGVNDVYALIAFESNQHSTNALLMLNGENGTEVWNSTFEETAIDCRLLDDITGDDVQDFIITLDDGTILGVDGSRGQEIWDSALEGDLVQALPMTGDVNGDGSDDIAFITYMNGIFMFNGSNGVELWHLPANGYYENLMSGAALNDINGNGSPDFVFGDEHVIRALDGGTSEAAWDTSVYTGSVPVALNPVMDWDHDGITDYICGVASGRLYAFSGNGTDGVWSYSNQDEGHGFYTVRGTRDIDGNNEMDVYGAMENGTVYCFAGSYVGINDVDDELDPTLLMPRVITLDPAYPNPFNSSVIVPFKLRSRGIVEVRVFDISGREVYEQKPLFETGSHRYLWHGNSPSGAMVPSGTYFMQFAAESQNETVKIQLIR